MTLRLVEGTFLDHEENPVEGATVRFIPQRGTYDESASYVRTPVSDTTDENGQIGIELRTGQRYKVVEPGDTAYYITVPAGSGTLSLEALRATEAAAPVAENVLQTAIDASLAALGFNGLTAIANPVTGGQVPFDSILLGATTETETVDLTGDIPEATDASGAWVWVRAQVTSGGSNPVTVTFAGNTAPAYTVPVGTIHTFMVFVPLTNGTFAVTCEGQSSTVNITVYPLAVQ